MHLQAFTILVVLLIDLTPVASIFGIGKNNNKWLSLTATTRGLQSSLVNIRGGAGIIIMTI